MCILTACLLSGLGSYCLTFSKPNLQDVPRNRESLPIYMWSRSFFSSFAPIH